MVRSIIALGWSAMDAIVFLVAPHVPMEWLYDSFNPLYEIIILVVELMLNLLASYFSCSYIVGEHFLCFSFSVLFIKPTIQLANYVIKLLLYADDLILIAKTAHELRKHLKALESFCQEVGMQVNTSKTKIMIFSLRRKKQQISFIFEGNPLEIVDEYKYLGLDFHYKLSWETCRAKRIQGGWKALYSLQNRCRNAELWDWKTKRTLFGLLVTPVVLYGCEIWGSSMSDQKWRQVERIQKHLIVSSLKLKTTIPYEILLAESGTFPLEAFAMIRLLCYLQKVQNMDDHRWPKLIVKEKLDRRRNTWMKQNKKWMEKWGVNMQDCPSSNEEIKKYVKQKFKKALWTKQSGRKKDYYIKEFNPKGDHDEKAYIGANIKWRAKMLIAQLRTSSHRLRCETGRWMVPKEEWEERICRFCDMGLVETEWHFVMECSAYKDIRVTYGDILQVDNLNTLFEEERLVKSANYIIKIHCRRANLERRSQAV